MATDPAEDIVDRLNAAAAVTAVLTGGVYLDRDSADFPLSPGAQPAAWETVSGMPRLKPCAVVSEVMATGPDGQGATDDDLRYILRIGFYAAEGYTAIRSGIAQARRLLDPDGKGERGSTLDDGREYIVRFEDVFIKGQHDRTIITADSEQGASYEAARFRVETEWPS